MDKSCLNRTLGDINYNQVSVTAAAEAVFVVVVEL
jgi:hypothetical protein